MFWDFFQAWQLVVLSCLLDLVCGGTACIDMCLSAHQCARLKCVGSWATDWQRQSGASFSDSGQGVVGGRTAPF